MRRIIPKVLHISFARKYDAALFPTWRKKFSLLTEISENFVVQGIRDRKLMSSHEFAHAYYIPYWFPRYLQYMADCLITVLAVFYFVIRREVVIIISHDPYVAIPVLLGKWLLRLLGRPIVVIVEAMGDWEEGPFLDGFLPQYLAGLSKLGDFAFKHADVTRAISLFTESKIKKISMRPCIVTPMYIDLSLFLADSEQPPHPQKSEQVLYAGVLSFRKGVHVLVQAFNGLAPCRPNATLLIIGEGEFRAELLHLIQASPVAERIRVIPFVNQQELKRHIDASAMVVLPSFSEGLGRILLEAMACGRPVVVSSIDGFKGLVSEGWNGLVAPPGDAGALAARIREILEQPELASKLGSNGKKLVQEYHSEGAFVKGYTALIATAIQQLPPNVSKRFRRVEG
jgi:glycosyltransferase involved in cell wall biosynthesis